MEWLDLGIIKIQQKLVRLDNLNQKELVGIRVLFLP
jgi:hypothetical protein